MVQSLSTVNTEELVNRCLKGNTDAQREMYERLASRMLAVCVRYVGDREMARDVLHDGFITLYAKLSTFKGEGSFEGWARRIFVTTSLMHLRKKDILKRAADVDEKCNDIPFNTSIIDKIDLDVLLKLVAQMPVGFRTVFNMFAIEGYTHQEIAKELNITEGGSRSQLSRARMWLKERLSAFK